MDLSGINDLILKEYASKKGLLFENHLYGCFALLEQRIDSSAVVLDCSFDQIGVSHGFFKDKRTEFTGSEAYQSLWLPLLSAEGRIEESYVDSLEDCIFDVMRDVSSVFFAPALDTGELPEALLAAAEASFITVKSSEPIESVPVKRRRLPRTRNKHSVTPMQKAKGLSKTRKAIKVQGA
jgi:hypothetical protein